MRAPSFPIVPWRGGEGELGETQGQQYETMMSHFGFLRCPSTRIPEQRTGGGMNYGRV